MRNFGVYFIPNGVLCSHQITYAIYYPISYRIIMPLVRLVLSKNNFDLTFLQNLTTIEVKQSPLFFTRTRGLFRECYPGPKDKAPNHENQGQGDTKKISKY